MSSSISTRVVLGILCLVALFLPTAASASPFAHTYSVFAPVMADDDGRDDKHLPTRSGTTPKRKPVRKGIVGEITPIKARTLRPSKLPFQPVAFNDPIRFTMTANKDSLAIGEEVEITIRAELLPITSSMMFFFEEQKSFSLKVLMPEGFVQTGGNYIEMGGASLSNSKPFFETRLKGSFSSFHAKRNCFSLLRGMINENQNGFFVFKGDICLVRSKTGIVSGAARKANNGLLTKGANMEVVSTNNPLSAPANCDQTGAFQIVAMCLQ